MSDSPGKPRGEAIFWGAYALVWLLAYAAIMLITNDEYIEQLPTGNLASGLADGLATSPWYYQHVMWNHGTLVYGLLLAPLYAYFGSYLLWLKLLAGLFAAGGTALWLAVARKAWGLRPALMLAAFFLAPPPTLTYYWHIACGNHMESIFWSGLVVWLFVGARAEPPSRVRLGLIGLVAGFASFFCSQNFAISAAVFVAVFIRWRPAAWRLLLAPAGFGVGFLPHYLGKMVTGYNLTPDVRVFQPGQHWKELFTRFWFTAPEYSWGVMSAAVGALFFLGILAALWRYAFSAAPQTSEDDRARRLGRLLLLFLGFFLLAYGFSDFYVEQAGLHWVRYLVPIYPALMALLCRALARLPRRAGWLVLVPALVLGAHDMFPAKTVAAASHAWGQGTLGWPLLALRGDDYFDFVSSGLGASWRKFESSELKHRFAALASSIEKLPRRWRKFGYVALGNGLSEEEALALLQERDICPVAHREDLALGAGKSYDFVVSDHKINEKTLPAALEAISRWQKQAPELTEYFIWGLGTQLMNLPLVWGRSAFYNGLRPFLLPQSPPRKAGIEDQYLQRLLELCAGLVRALPVEQKKALLGGIGYSIAANCIDCTVFPAMLGFEGSDEEIAAYRRSFADQFAFNAMTTANRLLLPLPVDEQGARQYLEGHGVKVKLISRERGPRYLLLECPAD